MYVTAGTCGPCRFGMYEAEYGKALRDSAFGNFRVLLFQQSGGLKQSDGDQALELNAKFAITLLKSIMIADMVNELGYKIRPYEVNSGETNQVIEEVKKIAGDALREHPLYLPCPAQDQEAVQDHRGVLHPGVAQGEDHRRVLGTDHRGRCQLPHVRVA